MKSTQVSNGIIFEEPLEQLRSLFRRYWILAYDEQQQAARDLWESEVAVEVESVRHYKAGIIDQDIQTLFYEEKRRVQDLHFLAEEIATKLKLSRGQQDEAKMVIPEAVTHSHSRRDNDIVSSREQGPRAGTAKSTGDLDLTSMIDAMLDEQRT